MADFTVHLMVFMVSLLAITSSATKVSMIHSSSFIQKKTVLEELIQMDSARINRHLGRSSAAALNSAATTGDVSMRLVSASYAGLGQYFVDFQMGTPAQKLVLIMDTGSDLTWVRCPAGGRPGSRVSFRSGQSTSFRNVLCNDAACKLVHRNLKKSSCAHPGPQQVCDFRHTYGGGSSGVVGNLSVESVVMKSTTHKALKAFDNIILGCASKVEGADNFRGSAGVLGLGRGQLSFPSQARFDKFSYCLVDFLATNASSELVFGDHQHSKELQYTPVLMSNDETFYYVGVESVSIGGRQLAIDAEAWQIDSQGNGGTVFDSGSTLTYLVEPAYSKIMRVLSKEIKLPRVTAPPLELCYNTSNIRRPHETLPKLKITFKGQAEFALLPRNYMVAQQEDVECVAIAPAQSFNIIGNLMQRNFHMEFSKTRIGFAWSPCS